MALITWEDSFSVGVSEMDDQHKKLVNLINKFYDSIKNGDAASLVEGVLNELILYVEIHFSSEEKFMRTNNYPDLADHIVNHNNFRAKINNYVKKINSINVLNISHDLLVFLKDWILNHIKAADMEYAKHFDTKNTK